MHRLASLVLLCFICFSAQAQEEPGKLRFLKWAVYDVAGMVEDGLRPRTIGYAAGATAILAGLSRWDEQINPHARALNETELHPFLKATNEVGNWKVLYPAAGLFAVSMVTTNTRFQDAAFTSLQSVFLASKISEAIKYAVGRSRPGSQMGADHFDPFSGHLSFPSGHATTAFAFVTPWVLYYPHPVTYGLFVLSTGTAVSRLAMNAHWTTDVLAGSAVGFTTAWYLTRRHGGRSRSFTVAPVTTPDQVGLALQATF